MNTYHLPILTGTCKPELNCSHSGKKEILNEPVEEKPITYFMKYNDLMENIQNK